MGMTSVAVRIYSLCMLLHGEALEQFDSMEVQNNGINNTHLKEIQEILLGYCFPVHILSKQNR